MIVKTEKTNERTRREVKNMKRILYVCDPEKNTSCGKQMCLYNPRSSWRVCWATHKKDCARPDLNGAPCTVPEELIRDGGSWSNQLRGQVYEILHAILQTILHRRNGE